MPTPADIPWVRLVNLSDPAITALVATVWLAELAPLLGGRSRVSEFFNGKRPLSIGQIQALRERLHIPADLLLEPQPAPTAAKKGARGSAKKAAGGKGTRPKSARSRLGRGGGALAVGALRVTKLAKSGRKRGRTHER